MMVETVDVVTVNASEMQRFLIEGVERQTGMKVLTAELRLVFEHDMPEYRAHMAELAQKCLKGVRVEGVMKRMPNGAPGEGDARGDAVVRGEGPLRVADMACSVE